MHCVSARTRSKRVLNDNLSVKHSTKTHNNPVSDFEVVGVSSDGEEYDTIVDFVEEVTESSGSDYNAMENEQDGVLVLSDIEKEDNEEHISKEVVNEGKRGRPKGKKGKSEVGGVKRRKVYGLDILIDENNSEEKKCAAQRTRSHFCSNNRDKKKLKLGTIAQPICIDDDDDESEEEKVGDFDDHTQEEEASGLVADDEEASGSDSGEQCGSGSKRKGHACVHNKGERHKDQGFHFLEILKDSIYGKKELPLKAREEEPNPCNDLPTKFSILHDGPKEAEKSEEEEEELEPIWAEMESGLYDTPDSCVSDHMRKSISSKFTFLHKDPNAKENSDHGKELEPIRVEMVRDGLDDTPKSYVTENKSEASELSMKKPFSPMYSVLLKDLNATTNSEEENGLESIWAEMECGLNDSPDSCVTGHKREASVCPRKKHICGDPKDIAVLNENVLLDYIYGNGEASPSVCPRKKHVRGDPKDIAGLNKNVLHDCIYGKGEVVAEEPIKNELNPAKELLPVFPFMYVEPKPPQKSDEEKELDVLWGQFDLALYGAQENSTPVSQVQNNNDSGNDQCPSDEVSIATLCRQGKHHLRLDEEIGLVCAYCLHVELDIKDYLPPFSENPFGKSNRTDSYPEDRAHHSVFNDFQDQLTGHDDENCCDYTGTVWTIIPGVKKNMYPHQREAFEFLWKNLAGGILLDQLQEEDFPGGGGCIISHAPGTGKTRLTITFLQTYMKLYPQCRSVIIAPKGMLLTWEEEFRKWNVDIPFHNLNSPGYTGKESKVVLNLAVDSDSIISSRLVKLYSWKCDKSILGISYRLFEQLTRQDCHVKEFRKFLLEHPGLLVLDEGHTPRNSQSRIWKAVSQVQTKKRIILSGTPFQNNLHELYNTLCLARPTFADWNPSRDKDKLNKMVGRPKKECVGKWKRLTKSFGKVTDDSKKFKIAKEVRNMMRSFVHVHKGTILQESLPGMKEIVVILKPTQLQKELFEEIQRKMNGLCHGKEAPLNVMKIEYEESVTAVHPALFDLSEGKGKFERLKWNPEESSKTIFLMELIRLSELVNEKVLVFCQYIDPLKLIACLLKHHFSWTEGREVLHIHGQVDAKLRQASIKSFNNPDNKVRVMLASTKACYEGISLVGASRVVLLDVVWNPSVERQAISRAYRLGQTRYVYTYHLITAGTMEEEKSSRQAEKDQLAELMFFNSDGAQHPDKKPSAELQDQILEEMVQQEKFSEVFEKVAIKTQTLL